MHEPALTLAAYPGRAALMDPNGNMQLAQYDPSYFTEQDYINDILLNGNGRPGYTILAISPTEVRVIVNKANSGSMCNDAVTITVGSDYTGMITIDCNPIISYHEETICGFSTETGEGYRYGFNGMEKDDEFSVEGGNYDFGARIYDPRLGRFLNTDPLEKKYAWYTPYQFSGNNPILYIDLDGLEPATPEQQQQAYEQINTFENDPNTPQQFKGIDKCDLAKDLREKVANPNSINQVHGSYMCGVAAIMRVMVGWNPESYVKYALDLYQFGKATVNGWNVDASDELKNGSPAKICDDKYGCWSLSPADFITIVPLRDAENWIQGYSSKFQENEFLFGTTTPEEENDWVNGFLNYRNTRRNTTDYIFISDFINELQSKANNGYGILMFVDGPVFRGTGGSTIIGSHFIYLKKLTRI